MKAGLAISIVRSDSNPGQAILAMNQNLKCKVCDDTGWVCENHRNLPWKGFSNRQDACDCGAGAPCEWCNPCDADNPPDMSRTDLKVTADKNGRRH
jgi:hypothetical protein